MFKRLAVVIVSTLVLALGLPGIAAADGDALDELSGRTKRSDPIWEGLCVGASLDLSRASEINCARQAAEAQRDQSPSPPPNIGAGLCVGASLDLSRASAKKCVAQTKKERPPSQPPNIGAGLCVGASLDISRASAAKCVKQTQQSSSNSQPSTPKENKPNPRVKETTTAPATPPPQPDHGRYAALGDSVAAGVGLSTPVPGDDRCGRTFDSYVYQVAEERGFQEIINVSCLGATLGDLFTEQGISGPNLEPQLDGAFASGTPELITITAGANDVRWDDFLRKCYAGTCGTPTDERVAGALLTAMEVKMQFLFESIDQRSGGSPPEVIMTGYYNPLSEECSEIEPRLTTDEIAWLEEKTDALNEMLEEGAENSGFAEFVSINFEGHDVCSDDPWVQTLDDPAPFHPTFEGQQAIAAAIL